MAQRHHASVGNGLALIFFGDPATGFARTKGACRGTRGSGGGEETVDEKVIDDEVKKFETFLNQCDFILHSDASGETVQLQKQDCLEVVRPGRASAAGLLSKVHAKEWKEGDPKNWKSMLSRYSFHVAAADEWRLQRAVHWTLILSKIRLDAENLKSYSHDLGEEYITNVVCFPQSWLSWVDNEWFLNNLQRWYIQQGMEERFGIPSVESTRKNEESDVAAGQYACRLCCVPNTEQMRLGRARCRLMVQRSRCRAGTLPKREASRSPRA